MRKEGPNTGRPFYVCPKQPQCDGNFFQWADVPAGNAPNNSNTSFAASSSAPTNPSYSSGASTSRAGYSSAANDNNAGPTRAKRKCSICKEEGHTRLKCERRPDTFR